MKNVIAFLVKWLLIFAVASVMIFGAFFLLLVDNVSRNLLAVEIPIGILTAFVGAPFFIFLMTRKESGI